MLAIRIQAEISINLLDVVYFTFAACLQTLQNIFKTMFGGHSAFGEFDAVYGRVRQSIAF